MDPEEDVKQYEQCWNQIKVDYTNWTSRIPTPEGSGSRAVARGGPLGPRPMGQNIKGADLGLVCLIFNKKKQN